MEEKILQAIEGLNQKLDRSVEGLNQKIEGLDQKLDNSIGSLRNDFSQKLDSSVEGLNQKIDVLSSQVQENTQILRALEHLAEVNKAEHDKMAFDIAEISGEIKSIRKDLSTIEIVTANNWSDIAKLKSVK